MGQFAAWNIEAARALIARMSRLDGAAMPILHALQAEFGYVDREAVPLIAEALNLSRAEVHGTVTFYHDFRERPAGRRVIKLCRAEACQAVGCEGLVDHLARRHGVTVDATTPDGAL
ncbi:MAG: NAD(P)H-dependent oxidoreductase subunit E, partial [Phreatobacter sp.]